MPTRALFALALAALLVGPTTARPAAAAEVVRVSIQGPIHDVQVEILADAIAASDEAGDALLVVELDTPGGLESSMRTMVQAIHASHTPVAIFVAPAGARAASAGFFLLEAADVAAMAEGTNTGAAHPVLAVGGIFPVNADDIDPTLLEKSTNDAIAFLRGTALARGRDADQALRAITENRTWTAAEALDADLIDLMAADTADLVARLDGRVITRLDGTPVPLALAGTTLRRLEATPRQHLLIFLANPMLALLLALLGAALLYLEFTHPGMIAPGVVGALALVLSLIGFSFLPINAVGVILIAGGLGLLAVEVFMPGFGVLGAAGLVALSFGAVILVKAPIPEMRIPLGNVLLLTLPFGVLVVALGRLALRAHRRPPLTGEEGMQGQVGEVTRALAPEGIVFVAGEIWKARASEGTTVPVGARVVVRRVDGLVVDVEPIGSAHKREEEP